MPIIFGKKTGTSITYEKTDNYTITTSDFGKLLRLNTAINKTFTLPSVDASHDGEYVDITPIGTGNIVVSTSDTDYVGDNNDNMITLSEQGYIYRLTYAHSTTTWQLSGVGNWSTT